MEYVNIMEAARRCGVSDKTIRRAIHAGKLAAHYPKKNSCAIAVSDLEAWKQSPVEPDATDRRLAELESRVLHLEQQVQRLLQAQPTTPVPVASPLPDDLVPLQAFADLHGVNRNEAERLWRSGFIVGVKQTPAHAKRAVLFLDAKGRRDFWVQLSGTSGFRSCDDCPHLRV